LAGFQDVRDQHGQSSAPDLAMNPDGVLLLFRGQIRHARDESGHLMAALGESPTHFSGHSGYPVSLGIPSPTCDENPHGDQAAGPSAFSSRRTSLRSLSVLVSFSRAANWLLRNQSASPSRPTEFGAGSTKAGAPFASTTSGSIPP